MKARTSMEYVLYKKCTISGTTIPGMHGFLATRLALPACTFFFFKVVNFAHISTHCRLTVSLGVSFEPAALTVLPDFRCFFERS